MGIKSEHNQRGVTLIELLIGLVLCGLTIAGIYRLFVAQSKAYTVQDQVAEVQQGIRSGMEILLRDLRMAGFDSDNSNSKISITTPIAVGDHSVTMNYEYDNTHRHEITYSINNGSLIRQLTIFPDAGPSSTTTETILENVVALNFTYGVDTTDPSDGAIDAYNGQLWLDAATVTNNGLKVIAIQAVLTANPDQTNSDVRDWVSPRRLASTVTLRNQCFTR